ncbi:MAG: peroxiredoxin [Coraliomargaritaceae bacterium]
MSLLTLLSGLNAEELTIGSSAPAVLTTDHTGAPIELNKLLSNGKVVVFFYPKADTPGCTKQACSLRDGWTALQERGVNVVGVSSDRPKAQNKFKQKYELPYPLIADTDQAVAKAFGKGRWSRQAYLFVDGTLVWRDLSASTGKQYEDVLAALGKLEFEELEK